MQPASPPPQKKLETWHWVILALGVAMILMGLFKIVTGPGAPEPPPDKPADFSVAPMPVPTYHPAELARLEAAPAPEEEPEPQATPGEKEDEESVAAGMPASMQPPPDSGVITPTETTTYELPLRIVIPSLKLDAPVERASFVAPKGKRSGAWQLPMKAAGWLDNTSLLGEPGNLVMSGHNNIGSKVFADLRLLNPNDVIIVKGKTREERYTVVERKLLLEKGQPLAVQVQNAAYILPDLGDTRLTLVTCWPPTNNTYRLIIIAQPQALASR